MGVPLPYLCVENISITFSVDAFVNFRCNLQVVGPTMHAEQYNTPYTIVIFHLHTICCQ